METTKLKDGDYCKVIAGTHKGKAGYVQDINTSKTGAITITILQKNGVWFMTRIRRDISHNTHHTEPAILVSQDSPLTYNNQLC